MKNNILKNKKYILIIGVILVLLSSIYGTIAYIKKVSNKNNTFITGRVKSNVVEEFDNIIKKNVYIENNGNVKEYVRVFINVYYKDSEGIILDEDPIKGTDYSITLSDSSNWLYNNNDNFYYYKKAIAENENTDILISECKELINHMGKVLNVDILSQTIQAEPVSAVTSSWHVTINDGNIVLGS